MALMKSYILRMFSLFSRLFFIFLDDNLQGQFVVFSLIDGISGCHQFLDAQMHFKDGMAAAILKDASGS